MSKKITIDAFVLSFRREQNLNSVIRGLRRQSFLRDIYVFHNAPSKKRIKGVINIVSQKNFGCIARHAFAMLSDCDYTFFIDDDIELKVDFSKRFLHAIRIEPNTIVGIFGMNVNPRSPIHKLYSCDSRNSPCVYSSYFRYIDIVKGVVHLCPRSVLYNSFRFIGHQNISKVKNDDDVILNLSTQCVTNVPSMIIPSNPGEFRLLQAPHAVCLRSNHGYLRSIIISQFMKMGWAPLANSKKFYMKNITLSGGQFLFDIHKNIFQLLLEQKRIQDLTRLVKGIGKRNIPSNFLYNYAALLREKRKWSDAKEIYHYIVRNGDNQLKGLSWFHLGMIAWNENQVIKAKRYLRQCLRSVPNHQKAREALFQLQLQTLNHKRPLKIVIGGRGVIQKGWLLTEQSFLNLLKEDQWKRYFQKRKVGAIFAEYVWEHLAKKEAVYAAKTCYKYLKPKGFIRVAVPDSYHPNKKYQEWVKPGGSGAGADNHKVLYTYKSLGLVFRKAGFKVKLLEYFDENGTFHQRKWSSQKGHIRRSNKFDARNKNGARHYTPIIIDAVKE